MKTIDDYINEIKSYNGPPLTFMEVCGTHTRSIFEYGIHEILPPNIKLISGPGCPVCVTPSGYIDYAAQLSLRENNILCTFGDMVRVPGSKTSLSRVKASGGKINIMYSPMDVIYWAESNPEKTYIVAAVGFETTLPIYALMLDQIVEKNLMNVKFLTSIKALMPALYWICDNSQKINGFIGPGHVSTIIGADVYKPLCEKYHIPLAVSGFSFEHIVAAIYDLIMQSNNKTNEVHNLYTNAVSKNGNTDAKQKISKYFELSESLWRGLGNINDSGYFLSEEYREFDAGSKNDYLAAEPANCLCGKVIIGQASPHDCPLFKTNCTPLTPVGPCMVSSEGTCGIWFHNQSKNR
ncbi:MAG: hydrogenase formation protein HypD [Bacillota bacterium]|nr:hydrogenase formation protein HypD [Bacillota bacterium]